MTNRRMLRIVIAGLLLPLLIVACPPQTTTVGTSAIGVPPSTANQAFITASYKTLVSAADVYEAGMNTAAYLYKQGKITPPQKEQIIGVATKYHDSWHLAQKTLEAYKRSETEVDKSALEQAMDGFVSSQTELLSLLNSILGGKK
jgi:hypothetical protein